MSETYRNIPPQIAFSSASVYPLGPEVLSTRRTTQTLGRNITEAHHSLGTIFGPENVGVSVLMGRKVDQEGLQTTLNENGVPVHSRDMPAKKSYLVAVPQSAANAFILRLADAKGHMGWAVLNAGSERQQRRKTAQGLEIATAEDVKRVKANAEFFNGEQGELLLKELKRADGEIILAVEIDAVGGQSIKEYKDLMKRLMDNNEAGSLQVRLDVDTGGLGLALEKHPDPKNRNKTVVGVVEDFIEGPFGKYIEFFSVNQCMPKAPKYHAPMDAEGGVVDIPGVARLAGEGIREGILPEDVGLLVEPDPRDQRAIFHGERGRVLFEGMRDAFNQGAGNVQEPALRVGR